MATNQLIPSAYEWLNIGVGTVQVTLWLALVVWLTRQGHVSPPARLIGILLAWLIPIVAPVVVWWVLRRPRQQQADSPRQG